MQPESNHSNQILSQQFSKTVHTVWTIQRTFAFLHSLIVEWNENRDQLTRLHIHLLLQSLIDTPIDITSDFECEYKRLQQLDEYLVHQLNVQGLKVQHIERQYLIGFRTLVDLKPAYFLYDMDRHSFIGWKYYAESRIFSLAENDLELLNDVSESLPVTSTESA